MGNIVNTNILKVYSGSTSGCNRDIQYFFKKEHAVKYTTAHEYGEVKEVNIIKSEGKYYLLVTPIEVPVDASAEYQQFLLQESALAKLSLAERQALGIR